MKLWLLQPVPTLPDTTDGNPWRPWWDKAFAFVVRAATEREARELANTNAGDEGRVWANPDYTCCEELTAEGDSEIVIRDFASA